MKFSLTACTLLSLGASAFAQDACIKGSGWSFQVESNYNVDDDNGNDNQCSYESLLAAFEEEVYNVIVLKDDECTNTVEDEFLAHLGVTSVAEAETAVYDLCGEAQEKQRKIPLSDVTYKQGSQFIEIYYSGHGSWNEETETLLFPSNGETARNVLQEDSQLVDSYYEHSQKAAFEMPDLEQFEPELCTAKAAMCCWPRDRQAGDNNGNCNREYDENCIDKDVADNTDLCYVELTHAPYANGIDASGLSLFPGDDNNGEGAIHCHGFAWANDDQEITSRYKANNLFYVSMYDHMYTRGYVENIPGAPMCGCVEHMPVVSRSDCTQTNLEEYYVFTKNADDIGFTGEIDRIKLAYQACQGANNNNNDLAAFVQQLVNDGKLTTAEQNIFSERVVGNGQCNDAISDALESHNFEKGYNIDSSKWTFLVGENFNDEEPIYDARLVKEMFEAQDENFRIVRRVCPNCSESHRDIYYKRLTDMPDNFDLLDTLMNNWFDTDNVFNEDFALYSTYMDAYYDENRWTFCNFNDPGIGFPRDCGPKGRVNNNWNSYYRGGGRANTHAFMIPSGPLESFESQIINIADSHHATVKQSSLAHGGVPERAIDGNTIGIWSWASTTHTRSEANPYWQISFDYTTSIQKVYFWNRLDCCRTRLNNALVSVYDYENGNELASVSIPVASVMNVADFGTNVEGTVVRITIPSGVLSLAEVQIQGDVITPAPTISAYPTTSPAPTTEHPGVTSYAKDVDDAKMYRKVYSLDIADTVNYQSAPVPYTEDYQDTIPLPTTGFNRVGYYLELDDNWVWVSFDAFTDDLGKIGVPTFASGAIFATPVYNMNVASSIPSLNAEGITGNIEFWPNNYGTTNVNGVPGASNGVYDSGDQRVGGGNYGSMQIHSQSLGGTIFAMNRWNRNDPVDLGIGNSPSGNPDWTFRMNGRSYTKKTLEVFVTGAPTPAPTMSSMPSSSPAPTMDHPGVSGFAADVADASGYYLMYGLDIPNRVNFQSAAVPYSEDYHETLAKADDFSRVAYYLELDDDWVFVSFDAFTDDSGKIGVPTFASGAIFATPVYNMNVASSITSLNAEDITGNIEFWPNNYGKNNVNGVPGASNGVYDSGDERVGGGNYGSMQVHSSELGGTIFAMNRWNRNDPVDLGIGNSPSGNPDWTFRKNGRSYTKRRMEIFVK